MKNNTNELYEGVADLDEAIAQRRELIEEAKGLVELDDNRQAINKINELSRKWRRIPYWESAFEDELQEEFEGYLNVCYEKRREVYDANHSAKKDVIAEAKMPNANMQSLMEKWKSIGSAGKEKDEELWQEFNAIRQDFYEKRHLAWENQKERFEQAKEIKENLIKEAEALVDNENIIKTNEAFKELFEKWRDAGRADSEVNDELWERFSAIRQKFNERRNAYFHDLREVQNTAYQAKKALIQEAKEHLEKGTFTKEVTERMKELSVEWKNAGSSGRQRDDKIWKEFRSIMDQYFDGLKKAREERQAQWQDRLNSNKDYKNDLIQNQKRQIERLEREKGETLSESRIKEIEETVKEKQEYIEQLEKEIEEIDAKLK